MLEFENHNRVEDYLDQTCSPMIGRKPYDQRAAIREELRSHLLATIEASKELGVSEPEAVAFAMKTIGKPRQVSRSFGIRRSLPWGNLTLALSVVIFSASLLMSSSLVRHPSRAGPTSVAAQLPVGVRNMHIKWAADHACTECHRSNTSNFIAPNGDQISVLR